MGVDGLYRMIDSTHRRLNFGQKLLTRMVGETLRVVRLNSRTPNLASSPAIIWLRTVRETPSSEDAARKLRRLATAIAASSSTIPTFRIIQIPASLYKELYG